MSEDQEWSRRVLLDGHTIVYEPRAAVRHSHDYSLREAFARFSHRALGRPLVRRRCAIACRAQERGRRYGVDELRWLWSTGHRHWIPSAVAYELSKLAGLTLGVAGASRP